jgi:hypothetical protein
VSSAKEWKAVPTVPSVRKTAITRKRNRKRMCNLFFEINVTPWVAIAYIVAALPRNS